MNESVQVLIPAFNAAATLPGLLERLKTMRELAGVLVVDDGSTDGTGTVAESGGASVIRHDVNRGKGAALRTGFRALLDNGPTDCVVTMDADLQHDVDDIPKLLAARDATKAGIVVGVRKRLGSGMPVLRILSNTLTSILVSTRAGIAIADSQCGYRLIGSEVLRSVESESDGFEAETEILIRAAAKGFSIVGVPVKTLYGGEHSHMTHWATTKRFIRTLLKEY